MISKIQAIGLLSRNSCHSTHFGIIQAFLESFLRQNLILPSSDPLWNDSGMTHSTHSKLIQTHSISFYIHINWNNHIQDSFISFSSHSPVHLSHSTGKPLDLTSVGGNNVFHMQSFISFTSFWNHWNEAQMGEYGNIRNYCKLRLLLRNDSKMTWMRLKWEEWKRF